MKDKAPQEDEESVTEEEQVEEVTSSPETDRPEVASYLAAKSQPLMSFKAGPEFACVHGQGLECPQCGDGLLLDRRASQ